VFCAMATAGSSNSQRQVVIRFIAVLAFIK
jgi:hypothetical protein